MKLYYKNGRKWRATKVVPLGDNKARLHMVSSGKGLKTLRNDYKINEYANFLHVIPEGVDREALPENLLHWSNGRLAGITYTNKVWIKSRKAFHYFKKTFNVSMLFLLK